MPAQRLAADGSGALVLGIFGVLPDSIAQLGHAVDDVLFAPRVAKIAIVDDHDGIAGLKGCEVSHVVTRSIAVATITRVSPPRPVT